MRAIQAKKRVIFELIARLIPVCRPNPVYDVARKDLIVFVCNPHHVDGIISIKFTTALIKI